ncbi:unnamed protein product [Prunus armeniaca]|uniref:Uncharacterized protein n=1 Tax=Prunus armeniaca TaxID=36596 RepID=A0A6J5X7M3_PRUAR|nr:unnamed protein product [Prunus armeniaca]CAB4309920.1 unnamed protein product [Prunus armeniaca]
MSSHVSAKGHHQASKYSEQNPSNLPCTVSHHCNRHIFHAVKQTDHYQNIQYQVKQNWKSIHIPNRLGQYINAMISKV